MTQRKQNKLMLPLVLSAFIDMLGGGIIIPILAPLIVNFDLGFFDAETSESARIIMFGIMVAIYPIAQFFGAPILGTLSDYYGRKPLLILTRIGTLISYLMIAYGIYTGNLPLIFFARFLDGLTGGNISVTNSAVVDLSTEETKTKNFGLIGAAFGLGFILGPAIGGLLSNAEYVDWFGPAVPFIFAAFLALINTSLLIFAFDETLKIKVKKKLSFTQGFKNVHRAFTTSDIEQLLLVVFLMSIGFAFVTQIAQLYLVKKFDFSESQIGLFFAYIGICMVISQAVVVRFLANKVAPQKVVTISLLALAIIIPLMTIPTNVYAILIIVPLFALTQGLNIPFLTTMVSERTPDDMQGEMLGINQSLQSLAVAIPPLVGVILFNFNIDLPFFVGGVMIFISWILFVVYFGRNRKKNKIKI